jgi:hypothetical protein
MAIQQPNATDKQNSPSHSLSHRVFANDNASPVQSVIVDSSGNTTIKYRLLQPMAELEYFNTTGTSITISGTSDGSTNMVKINVASSVENDTGFDNGGADNGRLRYTGATTRMFHCAVTVSGTPQNANDVFVLGVAKNGTVDCKVLGSASGTQFSALHCMVELATNDYIELYIGNLTASRNFTVKSLNIFAMGM